VTGPTGLMDGLAALMIATAVYCAGHLIVSWVHQRRAADADLMHTAMGVAMAAMLVATLDEHSTERWGFLFAVFAAWFALRGLRGLLHPDGRGRLAGQHGQHLLACGAMVYMLVGFSTPIAEASASMPAMTGGMAAVGGVSHTAPQSPAIAVALAVVLLGYAGWNVAELVLAQPAGSSILAPRTAIGCQIAMSVTMSYLLLTT